MRTGIHSSDILGPESQWNNVGKDHEREDDDSATPDTLDTSSCQHHGNALGPRAKHRSNREHQDRGEEASRATDNITESGGKRHGHGIGEQVGSANPESLSVGEIQGTGDGLEGSGERISNRDRHSRRDRGTILTEREVTITVASRLTIRDTIARVSMISASCLDGFHFSVVVITPDSSCL